jgi:SAM-dependent methyltransferase
MKNYLEIAYNTKEKPVTEYPEQLVRYLMVRFKIPDGARVLDNGCGRGDFMRAFEKCGCEVYGTDLDGNGDRVWKVDLEYESLPFEDAYFDVVFSKSVMEHFYRAENYLNEMFRILKPSSLGVGRLILMVPDWETQCRIFYDVDPTHIHPYTKTSVERLLKMQGYTDISSEQFCQLPSVWKYPYLVNVVKLLKLFGPVKKIYKNKALRFSRELMVLGTGIKQ